MLSNRIETAAKKFFSFEPEICTERLEIITEMYKKNENMPIQVKRAMLLDEILSKISIFIQDHELIVGNLGSKPRSAPIFPEFAIDYIEKEIDEFSKRPGDVLKISGEKKKRVLELLKFWKGKTVKERNLAMLPEETIKAGEDGVATFTSDWVLENGDGHLAIDYPKLVNLGLKNIIDFCENKIKNLDLSDDPENIYKRLFYLSVIIANKSIIKFANRYADLAEKLAGKEADTERKKELGQIADICRNVPENPARSFHEALQSIWFVQLALQLETNGHSVSIGRLDQFLYPLYKKDIKNGELTYDKALDLYHLFRIKLNEVIKLRSWPCTEFFRGFPMFQNITLGGQTPDRKCAANELTYIILDATEALKLYQPSLTARVSKVSSDKYLERCAEVISTGGGFPAMFNDDIIIPSMLKRGITEEDALNYCMVGCVEQSVPGKFGGRHGACFFNLVKALELALNNGKDPRTGITLKEGNGDLSVHKSFDEVMEAYRIQIEYYIKQSVIKDNVQDFTWEEMIPTPLCSSLVDDCLDRGKEIKKGGAVYDYSGGSTGAVANLANSLAAIKKLVFEDKVLSGKEYLEILKNNFEGKRGEEIKQIIINNVPKYGNDIDYVDEIATESFSIFITGVDKYKNTRYGRGPIGCSWHASTATVSANVPMGSIIGATPDGRKNGEPLSDVESAAHGTDKNSPTAVLRSASKLEHIYLSGGSLLNLKLSESSFK